MRSRRREIGDPWILELQWTSSALAQITDSDFNFAFHATECKSGKVEIIGWEIH